MSNRLFNFIDLHNGEERREIVLENVKTSVSFRGSNLWILACAIVIASVGLNVNSTAVIIGAMLISPLMGPIVGMGFALAIYDFQLLKKASRNLLVATLVSLSVATVYFYISPFKETQSELLARTAPNIYDVLIAFFGGLVGVIALTRVEKGNPIPGVAIATALMPPLCTAGYGLAIGNYTYFAGAIYLYSINCFFICISTFLIVKYLKYKPVSDLNEKYQKQIRYGITALIFVLILPSCYLAYDLFQERNFLQKVDQFIANEFTDNDMTIIYKNVQYRGNPKKIELAFLNKKFTENEIQVLDTKLADYRLFHTNLNIRQDTQDLKEEILLELGKQNKTLNEKDVVIRNLQQELNVYKVSNAALIKEINILFPEMENITLGKHERYPETDSSQLINVILYTSNKKNIASDEQKLSLWLQEKLQTKDIKVVREASTVNNK